MATLSSRNPATGEVVGEVPITPVERIDAIVAAARRAQEAWGRLAIHERADQLRPAADRILEQADAVGELICREMGKPRAEAIGEVRYTGGEVARELGEMVEALADEVIEQDGLRSVIHHDPFGVAAVITPWNFPFAMPHSMVLPALIAGNAVVLKPSEETPLVGQAYADLIAPLLPDGLLQVVHGADDQGKALVASDVDLIAFTGSRAAGVSIMREASGGLKRVVLELGGKDPLIVLADADLPAAARFAARNSFRNAGQVCVSTERIFVADEIADQFVDLLVEETSKLTVGDGMQDGTRVGPMVSTGQKEHVLRQIEDAVARGARIAFGGEPMDGQFVQPTVLVDVAPEMPIAVEETFGPVACVTRVDSADDAVRLANDTVYGLGAAVFGAPATAEAVARRLTAGMIGVNKSCGGASGTPWVGARQSGYGFHSSRDGHRQFAQTRVITRPI